MAVQRISYPDRESWLGNRHGLGASDAGAVCGYGFKTPVQLWQEKTGRSVQKDLDGEERIQFGNAVEEPMRALYRVMFPRYTLDFEPYTVLRRDDDHTFMFYTPDGWLAEADTGRRGLWECKSATCLKKTDWEKWRDKVPQGYYCQILHGMYVGGFAYADLFAILLNQERDATVRRYHFERADCESDLAWLLEKETRFWTCVEQDRMPGMVFQF